MSIKLIIILVIVLAIYVGTLEQARAIFRRQSSKPSGAIEASRNTLRGDLASLLLGINQVQGYIDALQSEPSEQAVKVAVQAQTSLDKAKVIKEEVALSIEKAQTGTALEICSLRLDQARFHVRSARSLIENHKGPDEDEDKN
jgi:hypothetical protein